jgi:aspartyl/asparaginyl-tRNA synthetase
MTGLLLAGLLVLAACDRVTPIKDILEHPREYADKTVTVKGEVKEVFSLVVVKYFVINDGTGRITVVTDRPLPARGERLAVKGTVREAFSLGDQSLTLIVEEPEENRRGEAP